MNPLSRFRLRTRLVLMALLATTPALLLLLNRQSVDRERTRRQILTDIQQVTQLASSQQATVMDGVQRLLLTLAQFPALRDRSPAACNQLLPNILRDHPGYLNLMVVEKDGSPFCEAAPINRNTVASTTKTRAWFERAITTRRTAVGDFQISATSGKPDVVVAQPLFNGSGASGAVERVLAAAISIDQLNDIASRAQLPPGAALALFDRLGTIVARYPDGAQWIGRAVPETAQVNRDKLGPPIVKEIVDTDSVPHLSATMPVIGELDTGLSMLMTIDRAAAFSETDRLIRQQWWLLGLVAAATIGVALVGGEFFVRRPIHQLGEVTQLLAAGDLTARARLAGGVPGLVDLAGAINEMANELEARHREQEKVQADLKRSEERLRQSQKIEAVGQLAAGIAHNFNNLLTVTAGYTELMLARHPEAGLDRADLDEINKATKRGAALTRQLLAFSRRHEPAPRRVEVNAALQTLREVLFRLIREDIRVDIDLASTPLPVLIDPHDLEQVMLNLVLNARDAVGANGEIRIQATKISIDPTMRFEHLMGGTPLTGDYVRIRVRDNGTGMTPDVRAHLFEPFFTTKEVGKGTGLGLASVYGIVQQTHGFIEVLTAPGAGTTFDVYIPMTDAPALEVPVEEEPASIEGKSRGDITILLVEDEETVRRVTAHALRRAGYQVLEAATPSKACDLFEQNAPDISLLLTDVVMPEMNGPVLAARLMVRHPRLRVLYVSGYSDETSTLEREGARFLGKPFSPSVLVATVAEMLGTPRRST